MKCESDASSGLAGQFFIGRNRVIQVFPERQQSDTNAPDLLRGGTLGMNALFPIGRLGLLYDILVFTC